MLHTTQASLCGISLALMRRIQMPFVKKAIENGCEDNGHDDQEENTAEKRVSTGKNFPTVCL